jgi:signal transduction histidine kinase
MRPAGFVITLPRMTHAVWATHDNRFWARVASVIAIAVAAVGIVSAFGDRDVSVAVVGAASAISVSGFLVASRWTVPSPLLFVWTALPAIALNLWTDTEALMFLVVVSVSYCTLVEPRPGVRRIMAAIAIASPLAIEILSPHDWGWPFWTLGIAFTYASSTQMRQFRVLVDELDATRDQLARQAVFDERRRIAAELHDLVGHSLTVVLLHLSGARRRLRRRGIAIDPETDADLAAAEELGRASLAEIRQNVVALRGDSRSLQPLPSAGDIPNLIRRSTSAGAVVELHVSGGDLETIEAMTGLAVYRVVQESLANVARHTAGAASVVEIAVTSEEVRVTVSDVDGRSRERGIGKPGVGLVGMRERVESLGGDFDAGPTADGWRVCARLPRVSLGPQREGGA